MRYIIIPLIAIIYIFLWYKVIKWLKNDMEDYSEHPHWKGLFLALHVIVLAIGILVIVTRYILSPILEYIINNW